MRRRVFISLLGLVVSVLCLTGCSGKYAEAKEVNARFVDLTEAYLKDLEDSDSAEDVAKAMNRYADRMESLWPRMKKVAEKYPELKDRTLVPDEMKESQKKAEEVTARMASVFRKLMPHMNHPEVRKAHQRISTAMRGK